MEKQITVKDLVGQIIYGGIDVHKSSWKVALLRDGEFTKVFSQSPDASQLAAHLKLHYPGADFELGYEAGFCGFWIQEEFAKMGIRCKVLHAADIPTTDKDRRQKTDIRDCRKIAMSLASPLTGGIHIPDKQLQYDRSVVRTRMRISRDGTRVRNRIKSHLYFYGLSLGEVPKYWSRRYIQTLIEWSKSHKDLALNLLLEQLNSLRLLKLKALQELRVLAREERYAHVVGLLKSVPGMGLLHAMCFVTEMGDIRRFKTLDQLCSMIGLIPTTNASGEKQGIGRMTKRGKTEVKNVLIEAAWIAIRHDKGLKETFERLSQKMKKNKAIIRIARKLVNRIRAVLIQNRPYK